MDVKSLYPSLEAGKCREIIQEIISQSELELENVEWKCVALYLAISMSARERETAGLERVIPVRLSKEPGGKVRAVSFPFLEKDQYDNRAEKWDWAEYLPPTREEKKVMMSLMLGEAVEAIMKNHT